MQLGPINSFDLNFPSAFFTCRSFPFINDPSPRLQVGVLPEVVRTPSSGVYKVNSLFETGGNIADHLRVFPKSIHLENFRGNDYYYGRVGYV